MVLEILTNLDQFSRPQHLLKFIWELLFIPLFLGSAPLKNPPSEQNGTVSDIAILDWRLQGGVKVEDIIWR